MSPDFDFDRFGVLGAGKWFERQAAIGTAFLVIGEIDLFIVAGEMVVVASWRSGVLRLLAPFAGFARRVGGGTEFLVPPLFLGILAEQEMPKFLEVGE
jgi:hypothetical protein